MDKDIDILIADTDKEIEKLRILKAKQEELKQLQAEVGVAGTKPEMVEPVKPPKTKASKPAFSFTPRIRKLAASAVAVSIFLAGVIFFIPGVVAADPAIDYADPDNGGLFAETDDGDGVAWTVNVSDADSNLAWVKLYANDSGIWTLFYDSGALGGVAYHNVSGQNGNWTGSWEKYYYNISADDGSTHDTTYSFTTGYQWGSLQAAVINDARNDYHSVVYKNGTNDYWLLSDYYSGSYYYLWAKNNINGMNWTLEDGESVVASDDRPYCIFTYNNNIYYYSYRHGAGDIYIQYGYYNGFEWSSHLKTTKKQGPYQGADVEYYDGTWQLVWHTEGNDIKSHYGTPPDSWTLRGVVRSSTGVVGNTIQLEVFDGLLHAIYQNSSETKYWVHWSTFDGVNWVDKGTIARLKAASADYQPTLVKDPINDQLVLIYFNLAGDLTYMVSDDGVSWTGNGTIFTSSEVIAKGIRNIDAAYMDGRIVLTLASNIRGMLNIYTISAPDYSKGMSGFDTAYNRIQWSHANPDDLNVNSTVFSLKNVNNRSINTIAWHFEDIGSIVCASNYVVWTNMSGGWTSIGTCDGSCDVSTLDISSLMAGGGEWIPGQTTYWKVEILDIGSVEEDLHSCDESIYYKLTFA